MIGRVFILKVRVSKVSKNVGGSEVSNAEVGYLRCPRERVSEETKDLRCDARDERVKRTHERCKAMYTIKLSTGSRAGGVGREPEWWVESESEARRSGV
jgi:hypothetical protein